MCKEEEEAIKVELHEGCGRTKLFWLLALADARTLKALVEFRDGGTRTRIAGASGVCRFCGATGNSGLLAIGNVCADHECQVMILIRIRYLLFFYVIYIFLSYRNMPVQLAIRYITVVICVVVYKMKFFAFHAYMVAQQIILFAKMLMICA